jgi:GAF domain-containing protein
MERETKIFTRDDLMGIQSSFVSQMLEHGIQSLCCVPLTPRKGELGTLNLASKEANAFAPPDVGFLQQVAAQVAVARSCSWRARHIEAYWFFPWERSSSRRRLLATAKCSSSKWPSPARHWV